MKDLPRLAMTIPGHGCEQTPYSYRSLSKHKSFEITYLSYVYLHKGTYCATNGSSLCPFTSISSA